METDKPSNEAITPERFVAENAKAAIQTLQQDLKREREARAQLQAQYDDLLKMHHNAMLELKHGSRAISIARHYGHEDDSRAVEDGRVVPALVLEKAVAVAIDAWADGLGVTIELCPEEVEQYVALVCVRGQEVTAFSADVIGLNDTVQEVWMPPAVLAALDHARSAREKMRDLTK